MSRQTIKTSDDIARYQQVTLLELLDRLLDKGVVVKGEILLSVADIDLVYLNLGLLLSSVKTIEKATRGSVGAAVVPGWEGTLASPSGGDHPCQQRATQASPPHIHSTPAPTVVRVSPKTLAVKGPGHPEQLFEPRAAITPENVEKGLVKLVLTLVDLIRKLMEKQAVRRMDEGQLEAGDIEKLGNTFFLLDEKMEQLKKTFGLEDEDLNIDLGPLGELL